MKKGQMLLEALIALSIFMIALSAVTVAVVSAVANARFTQDQNSANKWAQDGIERIRSLGFSKIPRSGTWAMGDDGSLTGTIQVNIQGKYRRTAQFEVNVPPCVNRTRPDGTLFESKKVTVNVNWNSAKCRDNPERYCHVSKQTTCISEAAL